MSKRHYLILLIIVLILGLAPWSVQAAPVRQDDECGAPATFIHVIQGNGERTPEAGQLHTIEGVVVGDYQDRMTQFSGFYMQEEDADADTDLQTSEGIFVDSALSRVDVNEGDVVRVTGTAFELSDAGAALTQLRRIKSLIVCENGASVTPTAITLPITDVGDWEHYEGMLVTFEQELTVTQLYGLGRYGEVMLSTGGRLYQPTNVARPGAAAQAVAAENDRRNILLDDGNSQQNADPTAYPAGGLSAENIIRSGYTTHRVTGVLDQRSGTYRLHVTEPIMFEASHPRSTTPEITGGRLRVASFNVLNYFNGNGSGGGFPTPRGAATREEFDRQRAKMLSALSALDADVIGLMEIENDGDDTRSAIADLVNGLNDAAGESLYAYRPDPAGYELPIENSEEGGDAIKQAIIYRPAMVTPVGDPVMITTPPFDHRRPSIVQAFEEVATGERFIVVVNHLKSKGCTGAGAAGDDDRGDGQGCWNKERVWAAQALIAWLETDPTGTGDPDVLLIGDLNSYAQEDPLIMLREAGYTNLITQYEGDTGYSYIYYGEAGSLDHALSSASLTEQVAGAMTWHINADEPNVFDYNVEHKTDHHVESLYDDGPYRSSDHDPVMIGLDLDSATDEAPTEEPGSGRDNTADTDSSDDSGTPIILIGGAILLLLAFIVRMLRR